MADSKSNQLKPNDAFREIVARLAKEQGKVDPKAIVDIAAPPDSPIHNLFEWDDTKAGIEYRIWQARQLISRIDVLERPGIREYINLIVETDDGNTRGYFSQETIMNDEELRRAAIRTMLRDLQTFGEKYKRHKEYYELVNTEKLDKMVNQYL